MQVGTCQAHTAEVTVAAFLEGLLLLLTGDRFGNLILWTVPPWRERLKPVCCFDYRVLPPDAGDATSAHIAEDILDSPTCCAVDARARAIFVAGAAGCIVSYSLGSMLEGQVAWQGVDSSGLQSGSHVPRHRLRQARRAGPREGRTQIPEVQAPAGLEPGVTGLIRGVSNLALDIGAQLEFGIDPLTGARIVPHLKPAAIRRLRSWRAHTDSISTMELILGDENGPDETLPEINAARDRMPRPQSMQAPRRPAALLTASHDQRVMLWGLDGEDLGQLRQGDTGSAARWHFPVTSEMVDRARARESAAHSPLRLPASKEDTALLRHS